MSFHSVMIEPALSQWGLVMLLSSFIHFVIDWYCTKNGSVWVKKWSKLDPFQRVSFGNTIAAIAHAFFAWGLIPGLFFPPESLVSNPIYGFSSASQFFFAWSCGYFLYDIYIVLRYDFGLAYVLHAFAAFFSIYFALFPFLHFHGQFFVGCFELSTPFLHLRTLFGDYFDRPDSLIFKISTIMFALFFVGVRIVANTFMSFNFQSDMYQLLQSGKAHNVPVVIFYIVSNILFYCLHLYWLKGIVATAIGAPADKKQK